MLITKYPYKVLLAFRNNEMLSEEPNGYNAQDQDTQLQHNFEDDYSICKFPNHREFVEAVREAEKIAKTGQRGHYFWRGYRGFVGPICHQLLCRVFKCAS